MNKLKSVVIPCTAQEYYDIVFPTLRACSYKHETGYEWSDNCVGVVIFGDSTWMASARVDFLSPTMTVSEFQTYHPLYTYATVHAKDLDDAVEVLRDVFAVEVDGNEIKLPRMHQESAAVLLFDALIPAVFSSEPCKSKQR